MRTGPTTDGLPDGELRAMSPGSTTHGSIQANLSLQTFAPGEWRPPILKTEATTGQGVPELLATIQHFRTHTAASQGGRSRARAEFRVRELLAQRFVQHVEERVLGAGELAGILDRIAARELDPYAAVDEIVRRTLKGASAFRRKDKRGTSL